MGGARKTADCAAYYFTLDSPQLLLSPLLWLGTLHVRTSVFRAGGQAPASSHLVSSRGGGSSTAEAAAEAAALA